MDCLIYMFFPFLNLGQFSLELSSLLRSVTKQSSPIRNDCSEWLSWKTSIATKLFKDKVYIYFFFYKH